MSADKPRRLGRGLEALIPSGLGGPTGTAAPITDLQRIPITHIRPNPYQPRREFDALELAELEGSLKATGLLQPITVRRRGDAFELVTGERRLRAATHLGWTEIQAIVREFDEQGMLLFALVENLQRTDLNPIDEARGYRRLIDDFNLTQQQVADGVGKDRTTITNLLRVLTLPDSVQRMVESGQLSAGHARALLALTPGSEVMSLAAEAAAQGSSVRDLERRVRELGRIPPPAMASSSATDERTRQALAPVADPAARRAEDELRRYLQTDVQLQFADSAKGVVRIAFYSHDDLDRLLDLILRERREDF